MRVEPSHTGAGAGGRPAASDADRSGRSFDDERAVSFDDDDGPPVLPDQTSDDTDSGWGERSWSNDDRLRDERPPHWD